MSSASSSFERHGWTLACLIPVTSALLVRGPVPIDETRYLSVAWEMWIRGDFVLPALNGLPYTHKPPLLFWLIQLGWALFGVNAWWPRLIPLLAAGASVWLTRRLAMRLYSDPAARVPQTVAWLLAGTVGWTLFSTVLLFDLVLTVCVLSAIVALERVERAPASSYALFAIAVAGGLLTKGPATFVFTLAPALLGPWWSSAAARRPLRWYASLTAAFLAALLAAGAWVVFAYEEAGTAFVHTILWDQNATRVVHSFAHARPWWFYLPVFPVLLLPWIAWPTAWRTLLTRSDARADRLVIAAVLPAFVIFSLISGKQPHYLLPLLPMVALWLGPRLSRPETRLGSSVVPALVFIVLGVGVGIASAWNERHLPLLSMSAGIVFGGAMMMRRNEDRHAAIRHLALANAATIALVTVAFFAAAGETYQLSKTAKVLSRLEEEHQPIAWIGPYNGQLNFLARLRRPVAELDKQHPEQIAMWIAEHPDGEIVLYSRGDLAMDPGLAIHRQPYHSGWLSIVPAGAPQLAQYVDRSAADTEAAIGN